MANRKKVFLMGGESRRGLVRALEKVRRTEGTEQRKKEEIPRLGAVLREAA